MRPIILTNWLDSLFLKEILKLNSEQKSVNVLPNAVGVVCLNDDECGGDRGDDCGGFVAQGGCNVFALQGGCGGFIEQGGKVEQCNCCGDVGSGSPGSGSPGSHNNLSYNYTNSGSNSSYHLTMPGNP